MWKPETEIETIQIHGRCNYTLKATSRLKASLQSTEVAPIQVGTEGLYPDEAVPGYGDCGE